MQATQGVKYQAFCSEVLVADLCLQAKVSIFQSLLCALSCGALICGSAALRFHLPVVMML